MTKETELYGQLLFAAGTGVIELDEFGAPSALLTGAPPLRQVKDQIGVQPISMVTDINGDTVVAGELYWIPLRNGETVKARVLRETYGAGNIADTYYRLYYMDSSLEEKVIVIQRQGCIFTPPTYPSKLKPVKGTSEHGT